MGYSLTKDVDHQAGMEIKDGRLSFYYLHLQESKPPKAY